MRPIRRMRTLHLLVAALLLAGCSASPALRPQRALDLALEEPAVAVWYREHSIPRILAGMAASDAKRWHKYRPAATVDRVKDGLVVRLQSRFGKEPRKLEVLLDKQSGRVLSVSKR